jgi:hypothetical protein
MPECSHVDGQPLEVPEREVEHGYADDSPEYADYWPNKLGAVDAKTWWSSKREDDKEMAEIRRRDEARKKLGGFGFQLPV